MVLNPMVGREAPRVAPPEAKQPLSAPRELTSDALLREQIGNLVKKYDSLANNPAYAGNLAARRDFKQQVVDFCVAHNLDVVPFSMGQNMAEDFLPTEDEIASGIVVELPEETISKFNLQTEEKLQKVWAILNSGELSPEDQAKFEATYKVVKDKWNKAVDARSTEIAAHFAGLLFDMVQTEAKKAPLYRVIQTDGKGGRNVLPRVDVAGRPLKTEVAEQKVMRERGENLDKTAWFGVYTELQAKGPKDVYFAVNKKLVGKVNVGIPLASYSSKEKELVADVMRAAAAEWLTPPPKKGFFKNWGERLGLSAKTPDYSVWASNMMARKDEIYNRLQAAALKAGK